MGDPGQAERTEKAALEDGFGVVVLTYGGSGAHGALFESLREEGVPLSRVITIHNPAAEGEGDPDLPAGCELVRAERNLGYAGGMNLGIDAWRRREEDLELLLLLTHDARLRPGALLEMTSAARRAPRAGVLGPALYESGTDIPFSFGGTTSPSGATAHRKAPPAVGEDGIAPSDWVDGGTLLVRLEAIDAVGGFEERFFAYCEESDLCLRVKRAGFDIGVVLGAHADQDSGSTRRPGAWAYLSTRNGIEYAKRFAGTRGALGGYARAARVAALSLLRTALRGSGLRPGEPGETWALAMGTARGAADHLRGRWGPPPPGLPGIGDVANA